MQAASFHYRICPWTGQARRGIVIEINITHEWADK
jgi:hypothetical protein